MQPLLEQLAPLFAAVTRAGGRPLVVGGAVRDLALNLVPHDVDVEVYGLAPDALAAALAPLGRVDAVGRAFGVLKLRLGPLTVDVAVPQRRNLNETGLRGNMSAPDPAMTPQEAAVRRDFTWNAMALTPDGALLDPFGGQADLRARVIRHVSASFGEDPLRVLRAVQFAARFDMTLAPETAALCQTLLPVAPDLPPERVWGEWQKWALKGRVPSAGLRALHESGWLAHYPELAALVGCQQRALYHPEGDVWTHTGHVCDAAAQIAEREQLDDLAREALLFGALCHDLGKPRTTTVIDGAHRSPGHAKAGVPPTETFLVRIGAPKRLLTHTVPLVREHMAHVGSNVSERTARRLALRLEPATIRLWEMLVEADFSGRPPMPPGRPGAELAALAERLGVSEARPAPVVQGRHLAAAGVVAGPEMGELLRHAYQAQIDGAFTTLDEGLAWIARLRGARAVRDP